VRALADGGVSPGVAFGGAGITDEARGVRYVAVPAGRGTLVATVSLSGGVVRGWRHLAGSYGVPMVTYSSETAGLSHDLTTLVLEQGRGPGILRRTTRFVLLDTRRMRRRGTIALSGDFSFDALSPDLRTLYLIEHLSTTDVTSYAVRAYDIATGRLLPDPIVDPREDPGEMQGLPMRRTATRDGRWVFTLYQRMSGTPFVHALDTLGRRAVCLDLPRSWSRSDLSPADFSLTPDERVVRVAVPSRAVELPAPGAPRRDPGSLLRGIPGGP
jgi:hypothetical protein